MRIGGRDRGSGSGYEGTGHMPGRVTAHRSRGSRMRVPSRSEYFCSGRAGWFNGQTIAGSWNQILLKCNACKLEADRTLPAGQQQSLLQGSWRRRAADMTQWAGKSGHEKSKSVTSRPLCMVGLCLTRLSSFRALLALPGLADMDPCAQPCKRVTALLTCRRRR